VVGDSTEPGDSYGDDDHDISHEDEAVEDGEGEYNEYDTHADAEGQEEGGDGGDDNAAVEDPEEDGGVDGDFEAVEDQGEVDEPEDIEGHDGHDAGTEEAFDLANVGEGGDDGASAAGSPAAIVESVEDEANAALDDVADAVDITALPSDAVAPSTQTESAEGESSSWHYAVHNLLTRGWNRSASVHRYHRRRRAHRL
jgi:hypothetical protein